MQPTQRQTDDTIAARLAAKIKTAEASAEQLKETLKKEKARLRAWKRMLKAVPSEEGAA